ncbi:MAG: ATP-binding protein [Bacteroidota bacterium]
MSQLINRDKYLPLILPHIGKEIIKIIIGQRRVGKSYFLRQIKQYILTHNPRATIIYINKESYDFAHIISAAELVAYTTSKSSQGNNVLIIDEVQEIKEFEKGVRHFLGQGFDIYLSGSNSDMLSGELATLLTGRYIQIRINPLTFKEFCTFHNKKHDETSLNLYLRYGGMPYLHHINLDDDEIVYNYLKNIYQTILLKDVVARYSIKNVDLLERLVLFLADNAGSIVSAKKISDFLKSQRLTISSSVITNYLYYLNNAFFIIKTRRYDLQGKRFLEIGEKYYFSDTGMRNALVGFKPQDINKILENAVYNHLQSMNYDISIGKLHDLEIDFIAEKHNQKVYIQVAYLLKDEKVVAREYGNLKKISDNFPKYVISMDTITLDNQDGIKHMKMLDFMLAENLI